MPKYISKQAKKAGLLPGSLTVIDTPKQSSVQIQAMQYDKDHIYESTVTDINTVLPLADNNLITWINIDGLHDPAIVKTVGDCFNVHPLILEDIVHVEQRPKMEEFDSHIYIVVKMFTFNEDKKYIESEQVSFLLCKKLPDHVSGEHRRRLFRPGAQPSARRQRAPPESGGRLSGIFADGRDY